MQLNRAFACLCLRSIAAATIWLMPVAAGAQAVEPGMRIRITQMDGYRRVGGVVMIRPDSALVLAEARSQFAVPLAKVRAVDISAGRTRRVWEHFARAVSFGAVVGGLAGFSGHILAPDQQQEAALLKGAAVGALLSAPLGIIAGFAGGTERWAPVSHPVVSPSLPPAIGSHR